MAESNEINEQILKELAEINSPLKTLSADVHKLSVALVQAEADKTSTASATSFQKRS